MSLDSKNGVLIIVSALLVGLLLGGVLGYLGGFSKGQIQAETKFQDKLWEAKDERWNMTLNNYPRLAEELCDQTFGENYRYSYTLPIDAAFGETTELEKVACRNQDFQFKDIPITDDGGESQ